MRISRWLGARSYGRGGLGVWLGLLVAGVVATGCGPGTDPSLSTEGGDESAELDAELASRAANPAEALFADARTYAAEHGVSVQEALRRLELQRIAGDLNTRLEAEHPGTFAGLYLEHTPEFRVVVRFTRDGQQTLDRYVAGSSLAAFARAEPATVPLEVLQRRLEEAHQATRRAGINADAGLNVRENRPEIYVLPSQAAAADAALMELRGQVEIVAVQHLAQPEHGDTLHGGLSLSTCTSGFTVRNSSGRKGITTSAHCGNTQYHDGRYLTFISERIGGSYDIQWHTRSSATFTNTIWDGSSHRSITATRSRSNQSVGNYVCKYGKTTGYTCGYIRTTSYCYDGACTWVRVGRDGYNLSEGGDSGGPWFNGSTAYGSHTLGIGDDSAYMAINYISGISVSVVTN